LLTYMWVEEKASKRVVSNFQFNKQVYYTSYLFLPQGKSVHGQFYQRQEWDCVKVLLTPDTPVEVRIGSVLWWVVCNVFFVLLLLVDNPVKANGDWKGRWSKEG